MKEGTMQRGLSASSAEPIFIPFIRTVQRIILYETKTRIYIVGSNNTETSFRVLKIDRTDDQKVMSVNDDGVNYSSKEIRNLLTMIDVGNRSKVGQKVGSGILRNVSAFGIVGFVRFLEGFYVLLITKRRKVAIIGQHHIYKIEDTSMVYIPNEDTRGPDEHRYLRMFNAMDLSSNFYFSYSYDLTQTVQHNLEDPKFVVSGGALKEVRFEAETAPSLAVYMSRPNDRYLWNKHLTDPFIGIVAKDWLLPIIHGFVDQGNVSIYGCSVLLALVARRSNRYAGTRFLKRGANFNGDVANEVETEQIVTNVDVSSLHSGRISSFVQIRGSVPGHWSQPMTAKPPIYFELYDPYQRTAGKHFGHLMRKYGSPIVVINLMNKYEENVERDRRREGCLSNEYGKQIDYLNQFLPEEHAIQYVAFDMARCKKKRGDEVIAKLTEIGNRAVKRTGTFFSGNPANNRKQSGVVRINCVDCLDRTNTAQYMVAKCALGLQLHQMGYLPDPTLDFDCDCSRMLESMYEDHGDTLALQYGGSQLIHRIRSYRKKSKWTSKAADITQTVRRYYSNALTDAEKQNAINVFLGAFRPSSNTIQIWDKEFTTDRYLHFPELNDPTLGNRLLRDLGLRWFGQLLDYLPASYEAMNKQCLFVASCRDPRSEFCDLYQDCYRVFELTVMSDLFQFKELSHSVRDYMPHCSTDFSPFQIRDREVKRREDNDVGNGRTSSLIPALLLFTWMSQPKPNPDTSAPSSPQSKAYFSKDTQQQPRVVVGKNPSVAGTSSTASNTASNGETDTSDNDDGSSGSEFQFLLSDSSSASQKSEPRPAGSFAFQSHFVSTKEQYGFSLTDPSSQDLQLYNEFVSVGQKSKGTHLVFDVPSRTPPVESTLPSMEISQEDSTVYIEYIEKGKTALVRHDDQDIQLYEHFVNLLPRPSINIQV